MTLDEVSFGVVSNPVVARKRVMQLYTNIQRRIESRFMNAGKVPGKTFLVSSKNKASDFLESYMDANRHRDDILIIDEPVWVIKGAQLNLSGETFNLAVGGRLLPHKILTESDSPEHMESLGYRILAVPIEYKRSFVNNMETALNDIAGIATEAGVKYMTVDSVRNSMGTIPNAFTIDRLKIGLKSPFQISEFFDLGRVRDFIGCKIYIGLDLSNNGDLTGIAIVKPSTVVKVIKVASNTGDSYESPELSYEVIGGIHLEAMEGSEIPYHRITEFVDFLADHFSIGGANADGFQSLSMIQSFVLKGYPAKLISVDRKPDAYHTMRLAMDEGRIKIPDIPLLKKEFLELEETESGKIDHPYDQSGNPAGSKDLSDAICNAVQAISTDPELKEMMSREKERAFKGLNDALADAVAEEVDNSDFLNFGW